MNKVGGDLTLEIKNFLAHRRMVTIAIFVNAKAKENLEKQMTKEELKGKITYVVVRKDLELSRGKWMAQVLHAMMRNWTENSDKFLAGDGFSYGSDTPANELPRVVVLYVKSETALLKLDHSLREAGIWTGLQIDAGFTEVEPNTPTCLVAGPVEKEVIQPFIKRLQLLKD